MKAVWCLAACSHVLYIMLFDQDPACLPASQSTRWAACHWSARRVCVRRSALLLSWSLALDHFHHASSYHQLLPCCDSHQLNDAPLRPSTSWASSLSLHLHPAHRQLRISFLRRPQKHCSVPEKEVHGFTWISKYVKGGFKLREWPVSYVLKCLGSVQWQSFHDPQRLF